MMMNKYICTATLGTALVALGCDPETNDSGDVGELSTTDASDSDGGTPGVTSTSGTGPGNDAGATSSGPDPTTSNGTDGDTSAGSSGGAGTTEGETTDGGSTDDGSTDGGSTDGGESDGGESGEQAFVISGEVVAGVAPGGNGVGTLYVGLVPSIDCFDGSSGFTDVIAAADLSAIGNSVPFSLEVPAVEAGGGAWLLQVFLDDNDNSVFETPDPGDMTLPPTGFEETAGCFPLPNLDGGDIVGLTVELDYIMP